ncbi:hypothetical protein ACRAWF_07925 [Streptomyces sp. L7]
MVGKPLCTWDSRDHRVRAEYDVLRRPAQSLLRIGPGPEQVVDRTVYGEAQDNAEMKNLRGRVVQVHDQAGVASTDWYDMKRQHAALYAAVRVGPTTRRWTGLAQYRSMPTCTSDRPGTTP